MDVLPVPLLDEPELPEPEVLAVGVPVAEELPEAELLLEDEEPEVLEPVELVPELLTFTNR